MLVYLGLSIASKYNERVAFKFTDMTSTLRLEQKSEQEMKPETLRMLESETMRILSFQVGDAEAPDGMQYSRVHEKISEALFDMKLVEGPNSQTITAKVNEASQYFA